MTKIKPFKAVIYNQDKIKDLSAVVCPPYDVISPKRQQYYHDLDPHNLIHILLGKDSASDDKYQRAADIFNTWFKNKILIQEDKPSIYFYSQQYNLKGETKTRFGFIALLYLEDRNSSIFGRENTRLEPKEDRLRLLRQVKANLSPIFAVFSDQRRIIQRTQEHIVTKNPFIDITDDEKTIHKLWRLDSADLLTSIKENMLNENIFIADGHHRYEVACAYREEMKKKLGNLSGEESFNYTLTYFTSSASRGLTILPIHRLVKLVSGFQMDNFISSLREYFDVEEVKDETRFFFLLKKAGTAEHVLGMYKDKRYWLLRLKNIKILDKMISDKPKLYRSLDVTILNCIVLKDILGIALEDKARISFTANSDELIEQADADSLSVGFFLNPVRMQEIMSIALSQEKMPAKSTYFYHKVLSGLVINKHED